MSQLLVRPKNGKRSISYAPKLAESPTQKLCFLHQNGVVFYRSGLFKNQIILDQNWALEAIYSIFHRDKCFKQLKKLHGRFSREDLELLIWSSYAPEEQKVFLGMMESCGICFKVRLLSDEEWEYMAPELLPEWTEVQEQLLGRLRDDPPGAEASATMVSCAIKYGCWFYEQTTRSQVLIESRWDDAVSEAGAGQIRFRAWGQADLDEFLEAFSVRRKGLIS
jgi:C-terminal of Roc, COR, domain